MTLDVTGSQARSDDAVSPNLDIIVFSKDRACQLDSLLRSVENFLDYPHRIHLLYTTSSLEYERGYDLLRRWHTGIDWIGEHGQFGVVMKNLVARIYHGPGRFLMFLADDMMFIRQFSAQKLMESLVDDKDILAVSLQLGQKIIATCKDGTVATTGEISQEFCGGLRWTWKSGASGYRDTPMSLEAQVFRLKDFAALIHRTAFKNPHELATVLSERPFPRPDRVCEHQPSVINITASHVRFLPGARRKNISKDYLQKSFMRGMAIDTTHFANRVYSSCQIDEDIPLIEDERPRKLPEIEIIQKNGQAYYRVDLRTIPTFVINCDDNVDYRVFQQEQLNDLGFNFEFIRGFRVQPGWVGVALGHLKTLRLSRAQAPFLVLEDDCTFVDGFNPVLEIPIEAEAYYLGVSTFGLQTPGVIGWGKHNATQWQRFDADNLRVFNMLARHAVLYLDDKFCKEVIESQVEALTNRDFPHPGDIGLACLHASHVILTPERNVCRQSNRSVTHVALPEVLPGNELPPDSADENSTKLKTGSVKSTVIAKPVEFGPGLCLISHKYRFIYFSIAKNASSSLRREFIRACYEATEVRVSQLDEDQVKNYFKFTFLRDPVSRLSSAYQEISLRNEMNDFTVEKKKFMEMDDGPARFEAFVDGVLPEFWDVHIRPQSAAVAGVKMDFYGRVETLQKDLESIFKKLEIEPCPVLPRRRSREGRKNDYNYKRFNIDHARLPGELVRKIRKIYQQDIDLIEANNPVPALLTSAGCWTRSSQSSALKYADGKDLQAIELYSLVNESHSDCLVYCLGDRGFYAEISTVARAMIYAWCHDLQLLLDCDDFAWGHEKGWTDYFEAFCPAVDSVDPHRIKARVAFTLTGDREPFNRLRGYMPEEFDFGNIRLKGFQTILAFFMKMIFRPVKDSQAVIDELIGSLNLPMEYDAIHIRRGDKVGDEDVYYPTDSYLERLEPLGLGQTLFVMSDSYKAVEEVRESLKRKNSTTRVVTLIEPERTGFDVWKLRRGEQFMGAGDIKDDPSLHRAYIREQTRVLIAETMVAAKSRRFVSTWLSNVGRTVWYLHPHPEQCVLLQAHELEDDDIKSLGKKPVALPVHHDWAWQSTAVSGDALGVYRKFNESGKQCLVYQLSSRGVFEEINGIVMAMIYARMNGLQLVLNIEAYRSSLGLRWDELFESFCASETDIEPARVIKRVSLEVASSLAELGNCKPDTIKLGPIRLSDLCEIRRFFHSLVFRPARGCLSRIEPLLSGLPGHEEFDVLLFRRDDKSGRHVSLIDCMKVLGPIPSQRILVLVTDDEEVENRLRGRLESTHSGARLLTLLPGRELQEWDTSIFEIMQVRAALKARYFVSNRVDAAGRAASLMHLNGQWCHMLSPAWKKRAYSSVEVSRPDKFMVEVQLQDGRLHRLELPSGSPLIQQLKLASLVDSKFLETGPATLIQLPVEGGRKALAFSSTALTCLRIIPESPDQASSYDLVSTGNGSTLTGSAQHKPVVSITHQPMTNVSEGHLGAHISARHIDAKKHGTEDGDESTRAPGLLNWICDELGVRSVLDVGCGEGHSTAYFQGLGCRVLGIDGSEQAKRDSLIPEFHLQHDYTEGPFIPDNPFDLVWCCEFVEHVEERFTHNFLATFANATKYIFMTHAGPGQAGWHHVNCQPQHYWINKVERLGYRFDEKLSQKAREISRGHFSRTGLVFVRDEQPVAVTDPPTGYQTDGQCFQPAGALPVNAMKVLKINAADFHLFLDIFVHPSRQKVVAVLPYYFEDWNVQDHGIDFQNIELIIGKTRIKGEYIPHRLDSWEPCALLDFEDQKLTEQLTVKETVNFTIKAGPHSQEFSLSTLPAPSCGVLMSLVVKNENRWIRHFLAYYLECLNVDHILVYDNGTEDQNTLLKLLAPYQKAGTVTYIPWNYRWRNIKSPRKMIAQPQQEAHSLNRFANSRWIGFFDVDEFLRLPGNTLPGFLSGFEKADVDGLSFGLRWFHYDGVLEFDEIIDPPLTFLQSGRDELGRKRQKLIVSPRHTRFLRLHTLEETRRELQVDDTDLYFHHYCQRDFRFKEPLGKGFVRDPYMLRFSRQLSLEGSPKFQPARPRDQEQWVRHITCAIAEAEAGRSRLEEDALKLSGLCGTTTRHFYNNICNFKGCRYLEIGSFTGASTVAATYGNGIDAVCIDNFSQFHGTREEFEANIRGFKSGGNLRLIEKDCFELAPGDIKGELDAFDVYLYDGAHSPKNQYKAILHFAPVLAPLSVVIIDDWNWDRVRAGTEDALRDSGIPVLYRKEIILPEEDVLDMPRHKGRDGWWNGICILLLGRPAARA